MEPNWRWRWLDTFDWYTPTFQWKYLYPEVYRWFRDTGFEDVQIFDGPIRMSARKGLARERVIDTRATRARTGGVLTDRRFARTSAGSPVAFGGLVAFTAILLLTPQTMFPVLKTLRIALLAAGVAIAGPHARHHDPAATHRAGPAGNRDRVRSPDLGRDLTIPFSSWPSGSVALLTDQYLKARDLLLVDCDAGHHAATASNIRLGAGALFHPALRSSAFSTFDRESSSTRVSRASRGSPATPDSRETPTTWR